jgi:hypothetical protein
MGAAVSATPTNPNAPMHPVPSCFMFNVEKRVSILDGGGEGEGYLPNNFRRCHQACRRRCLATMVHGMRNGLVQPTDTNGGHV